MIPQTISSYRLQLYNLNFLYQAEVFNKAIWGDMGEDSAQISISCTPTHWHLSFIRTQSGDPSPFEDFICNVIDQYEKQLTDEQLYEVLALHQLLKDFDTYCFSILPTP